jgi:hypothetical protein
VVAGFLSANARTLRANPLGAPIGCQTWPVRGMIAKDFPGTIKQLAEAGAISRSDENGMRRIRANMGPPRCPRPDCWGGARLVLLHEVGFEIW